MTHISKTVQPILTKLETYNYLLWTTRHVSLTTYRCVNVGGLGEHPVCHCKFLSLPFFFDSFISRTGRTSGPICTKFGMYKFGSGQ